MGRHAGRRLSAARPDRHHPRLERRSIDDDLKTTCLKALELDHKAVRAYVEKFSCPPAEQFVENLRPFSDPERSRFWRRLRRIARLRRRAAA